MDVSKLKAAQVPQVQALKRQESERAAEQNARNKQASEVKPAERNEPKPVVNTQGQTTGRMVNVSA
jgi:hypothetical protein